MFEVSKNIKRLFILRTGYPSETRVREICTGSRGRVFKIGRVIHVSYKRFLSGNQATYFRTIGVSGVFARPGGLPKRKRATDPINAGNVRPVLKTHAGQDIILLCMCAGYWQFALDVKHKT